VAVLASQERSQSWLGRKCGKSTSYVSRVVNGTLRPTAEFRVRAAEALGIPETLLFPAPESEAA
jgi:transcriptional regulator with XRE-family HTH domain